MKRVVVFAHYDKNNKIDDYVAYYLKSLKEVGCEVVFVSCCELDNSEIEKVKDYVIHSICEKHDEYDFGSYKRGFLYLKNFLNVYDELVFANDSCYGPIYPISEVFANMEKEDCDFWGITKNNFGYKKSIGHFLLNARIFKVILLRLIKRFLHQKIFKNLCSQLFIKIIKN